VIVTDTDNAAAAAIPSASGHFPASFDEALKFFEDPHFCVRYLSHLRWPEGIECPYCQRRTVCSYVSTRRVFKCRICRKQFSPRAKTILEDSAIPLNKWFAAIWMLANSDRRVSSVEIHRVLGISQKSAWFLLQRLRLAAQSEHESL
jgi:transposase-like protein